MAIVTSTKNEKAKPAASLKGRADATPRTSRQRSEAEAIARGRSAIARQRSEVDPALRRIVTAALEKLKTPGVAPSDVLLDAVTQAAAHGAASGARPSGRGRATR